MTCILYKMKMNELFEILIRTWLILFMNKTDAVRRFKKYGKKTCVKLNEHRTKQISQGIERIEMQNM